MIKKGRWSAPKILPNDRKRWRDAGLLNHNKAFEHNAPAFEALDALTLELHANNCFSRKFAKAAPIADARMAALLVASIDPVRREDIRNARDKLNDLRKHRREASRATAKNLKEVSESIGAELVG